MDTTRFIIVSALVSISFLALPGPVWTTPHASTSSIVLLPGVFVGDPASFITNYSIPIPKNSQPDAIVPGLNQTLWFTEFGSGSIGEFNSTSLVFSNYTIPEKGAIPATLSFDGSNHFWFTDQNPNSPSIWMMDITGKPTFTRFLTNAMNSSPVFVLVDHLTGNVWFTDTTGNYLGEIDHTTLRMAKFPTPIGSYGPVEIAFQNGTSYIWMTERAGKVARFDTRTNTTQEFNPSVPLSYPVGIVVDKQGNVWVSEHGGSAVVEFNPSSSIWRKYPTSPGTAPPGSGPATLTLDSLGRLWFAEHYAGRIGRLDTATGAMDEFTVPIAGAYSLLNSIDGSGNYWFAMAYGGSIGMIRGNATSSIRITPVASPSLTVVAGQALSSQFLVRNNQASTITLSLGPTSFFTTNYYTTGSEVSLSAYNVTLAPGENKTIVATVTPDFTLSTGIYTAGLVASYDSVASVGVFFIQVNESPLHQLETFLPYILIAVSAAMLLVFLMMGRTRKLRSHGQAAPAPKISLAATILVVIFSLVQETGQSWAKCLGQPPPAGGGGPDYYGIALDVGSVGFFAIVAYFLIRSWLRGRSSK